jgi:metallo-beta-lactamase family protein
MMNGGRVVHHARHYLPDPNNTLLLVGYQAIGTLGRVIQSGEKNVRIFGETIPVRATIDTISGFSGHKGSDQLVEFVKSVSKNIETVYVVMGETTSSQFLAERLRDQVAVNAVTPKEGEHVELYL